MRSIVGTALQVYGDNADDYHQNAGSDARHNVPREIANRFADNQSQQNDALHCGNQMVGSVAYLGAFIAQVNLGFRFAGSTAETMRADLDHARNAFIDREEPPTIVAAQPIPSIGV
jgi:hypothetical protein